MDVVGKAEHVVSCVACESMRLELGLSVLCCSPLETLEYWIWWRRVRLKEQSDNKN